MKYKKWDTEDYIYENKRWNKYNSMATMSLFHIALVWAHRENWMKIWKNYKNGTNKHIKIKNKLTEPWWDNWIINIYDKHII